MTQYRNKTDKIATFVGKNVGGLGRPMVTQAVHTWEEPMGDEPVTPNGNKAMPDSIAMIKWKVLHQEEYASLCNFLWDHCAQDFHAQLKGRPE